MTSRAQALLLMGRHDPPVVITLSPGAGALAAGNTAAAYSQSVTASGGTAPYTYAVTSGALPAGLALNVNTGAITGTPTTYGTANFSVTATDASAHASSPVAYTIAVAYAFGATTTAPSQAVTFTTVRINAAFSIDWGDTTITNHAGNTDLTIAHTYASAATYPIVFSVPPTAFIKLDIRDATISGSITGLTLLIYLRISGNALISGSITGLTLLTSLYIGGGVTISGSITGLTLLTNLTISNALISGSITGLTLLAYLLIGGNALISGSITGLTLLTSLTIYGNAIISGSITGLTLLTSLYISGNAIISGSITGLTLLTSLYILSVSSLPIPTAFPIGIHTIQWENNLTQANVDAFLLQMYAQRLQFTFPSPTADLNGSGNAAPSGAYAHEGPPPTTGNGAKWELVNDTDGEGIKKWAIQTA